MGSGVLAPKPSSSSPRLLFSNPDATAGLDIDAILKGFDLGEEKSQMGSSDATSTTSKTKTSSDPSKPPDLSILLGSSSSGSKSSKPEPTGDLEVDAMLNGFNLGGQHSRATSPNSSSVRNQDKMKSDSSLPPDFVASKGKGVHRSKSPSFSSKSKPTDDLDLEAMLKGFDLGGQSRRSKNSAPSNSDKPDKDQSDLRASTTKPEDKATDKIRDPLPTSMKVGMGDLESMVARHRSGAFRNTSSSANIDPSRSSSSDPTKKSVRFTSNVAGVPGKPELETGPHGSSSSSIPGPSSSSSTPRSISNSSSSIPSGSPPRLRRFAYR